MKAYCLRVGEGDGLVRPVGLVPGLAVGDIVGDVVGDIIGEPVGDGEAIVPVPVPVPVPVAAVGEGDPDVIPRPESSPQAPVKSARLSNPAAAR